jgi:tetratricopeptide (TPR) repeat protein
MIELLARFPEQHDMQDAVEYLVTRSIKPLVEEKKFDEALAAAKRHKEVFQGIQDDDAYNQLLVYVYDAWGHHHMREKNWPEAVKLYERALGEVPEDGLLSNNLAYSRQELTKKN